MKKYWIPITIAVAGLIVIFNPFKKPESVMGDGKNPLPKPSGGSTDTTGSSQYAYPLKKGSKGSIVTLLQQALTSKYLPKYGVDGDFGAETEAAVQKLLGKKVISSKKDIDTIATLNGLVYSNGQYVPKLIAAPQSTGMMLTDINKLGF